MSAYLDKYNPQTDIFESFKVADNLPLEERAFATWKALLLAKRSSDGLFLVIGKLLKDVRDEHLYEKLDYENFAQFLDSEELSFSREKAYMCIKTYEYYVEVLQLDPENIKHMNVSRLSMMVPVLKKIENRDEVVKQIEAFNNLRHNDFVREIKNHTNRAGKPSVYWNEEMGKWDVGYFDNTCFCHSLGIFEGPINAEETETTPGS